MAPFLLELESSELRWNVASGVVTPPIGGFGSYGRLFAA